ncbi:MAG: trypsin-like peptidase domain-containing protein [Fuerstiella sp.]
MLFQAQRVTAAIMICLTAQPFLAAAEDTAVISTASSPSKVSHDPRHTPLVKAVKLCQDSVVNIHTERNGVEDTDSRFFTPKARKVTGMGTGIIVDERGYIVTNYHVIQDVDTITVTLHNGETLMARPVSFDRKQDMAIIQVNATAPLSVMLMGTSTDVQLAEQVFAVGNPFGYGHTVTAGIVSALDRDVEVDETQAYENLIQTDASINPGNSGGPLLNVLGEVIGINVAIRAGAQRIGFAIPIDDARRTVARLLSTERLNRVSHGVFANDVKTPEDQKLVVEEIAAGSAAQRCGLQKGDTIRSVRGITIHDNADLERSLLDLPVGKSVDVDVDRDGKSVSLNFIVGQGQQIAKNVQQPATRTQVPVRSVSNSVNSQKLTVIRRRVQSLFGMTLVNLTAKEIAKLPRDYKGGLRVASVNNNSVAAKHRIQEGDFLLGLDGFETLNDANLEYILNSNRMRKVRELKFTIFRGSSALEGYMPAPR